MISLSVPGYVMYRTDRKDRKGGVVALLTRHDACCHTVAPSSIARNDIEILISHMKLYNMLLLCVYMPQSLSITALQAINDDLIHEVLCRFPYNDLIILGDFNQFRCHDLCGWMTKP